MTRWSGVDVYLDLDHSTEKQNQELFGTPLVPFCKEALRLLITLYQPGILVYIFGTRSLNGFLDYDRLSDNLIKRFQSSKKQQSSRDWEYIAEIIRVDDRHDLYQNLPCYMNDMCKVHKEVTGVEFKPGALLDELILQSLWSPRQ